jgi:hypothetical protein
MAATDQMPEDHRTIAMQEPSIHGPRRCRTKTAVDRVGRGKERQINMRFLAMTNHYVYEPEFCNPAAGWGKPLVRHWFEPNGGGRG